MRPSIFPVLLALLLACVPAAARHTTAPTPARPAGVANASAQQDEDSDSVSVKHYNKIIPATAQTRRGLFITHRVGPKLYFEIPAAALRKDMLLVGTLARTEAENPAAGPYGGDEVNERVLRWEREGNRIILRSPSYELTADSTLSVARAVATSNYAPVVAVFPVEAYGPDSAAVIDVTRLYTTPLPEFVGMRGHLVEARCYVERAAAFPDNVEVEATQTIVSGEDGNTPTSRSALVHWSMVRLPEHPMLPRREDPRVGYFDISQFDFGTAEQRAERRDYITRWRLEKKDTAAAVSDPVKPLVYYIDPGTPDKWKPWIKKGIEDWQPAFEAAGFSHAIVAKDAPVDDPDWSMDDVRHTVVRWLASTQENAYGPNISDPRTGEVLNGTVHVFHNVLNLLRDWYFVQVSPLDVRAQRFPLPDSLMGRLLEYVVAHEVGHTLGLRHDQLGSAEYPADSVRSRTWVHRMGHTPSVMDYSRFNYVAQPEDSIALEDLIPRIGPYDLFAIHWGYAPIPGTRTLDDEKMTLDTWARAQDSVPWYRFSEQNAGGYGTLTEAVGDADPVRSTGFGIRNLRRVLQLIPGAALRPGENNADLRELYARTLAQWRQEMLHVATMVGGASVQYKSGSQPGPVYAPLPASRQRDAVRFLDSAAFRPPQYFVDPTVTRRFEPEGTVERLVRAQASVLAALLAPPKLHRLAEYEAVAQDRNTVYPLATMLADVREGIWSELSRPRVSIDAFRQGLQQAYLEQLNGQLYPPEPSSATGGSGAAADASLTEQERALLRGELLALRSAVRAATPHAADRATQLHLETVGYEIGEILKPTHGAGAVPVVAPAFEEDGIVDF